MGKPDIINVQQHTHGYINNTNASTTNKQTKQHTHKQVNTQTHKEQIKQITVSNQTNAGMDTNTSKQ